MRNVASIGLLAVVVTACGGEAPPAVVRPPPLVVHANPPAPTAARWVFEHPERGLTAKLDLGGGSVLYVGQNGRRELGKGTDALVDAPTLVIDNLMGVLRDDKNFAFFAADGYAYIAHEPLGAIDSVRPGPLQDKPGQKLLSLTTGKSAAIAIAPDGRVLRSTDLGATWRAVDYAGANKPFGHPSSVALDGKGNGLLLHKPQRLFATTDDGATWTPVASAGIGARWVRRDGGDQIYIQGFGGKLAKWDGKSFVAFDKTIPVYTPPPSPETTAASERGEIHTVLTGDHVVEFAEVSHHGKAKEIQVSSAKLGEKQAKPVAVADLAAENGLSKGIAGWNNGLMYLREDDDADENAPTTTAFESKDFGATWVKGATLQGAPTSDSDSIIALGPKGWAYISALCPHDTSSDSSECTHRQIRPTGTTAFEGLAFVEEFTPTEFAFDEAHDKVYALGEREGHRYIYASPLSQNKFTRTKALDAGRWGAISMTVDATGMLRVFEWDSSKRQWAIHRLGLDGKDQPALYLGLDRGTISFAGARGLMLVGHDKGYETSDGGETWTRVATNGYVDNLKCSDAGCVNGGAQRVGWDLPVVQNQEKVAAQAEPVKMPASTYTPPPAPATPSMEVTCKPTGAASNVSQVPSYEMLDSRTPESRWGSVKNDEGKVSILVGSRTQVRELPLVPAPPKPKTGPGAKPDEKEWRTGERVLNDGVVAARYSFAPRATTGQLNPVDIDFAWWSLATGRVSHHSLTKIKPFRISRYGFSGSPQLVDGGLLFQTTASDPIYFIHDDGKVETFNVPQGVSIRNGERAGKRWVFMDDEGPNVQLTWSDDAKEWKQRAWGLDDSGLPSLTLFGDKPTIVLSRNVLSTLLFGIDGAMPDDPPAPTVIDATNVDVACDAKVGRLRTQSIIPSEHRTLRARIDNADKEKSSTLFTATTRVLHDTSAGKMCTAAYVFTAPDSKHHYINQTTFLYPEASGWSGWRFTRNDDPKTPGFHAQPLACQLPK